MTDSSSHNPTALPKDETSGIGEVHIYIHDRQNQSGQEASLRTVPGNDLHLLLSADAPERPAHAVNRCHVVYENGNYKIEMLLNEQQIAAVARYADEKAQAECNSKDKLMGGELNACIEAEAAKSRGEDTSLLSSIILKVNGTFCGFCSIASRLNDRGLRPASWNFPDARHFLQKQKLPFLRQYDLLCLQIEIVLNDGRICNLYSPWLICTGLNQRDNDNLIAIINQLNSAGNSYSQQALSLIFTGQKYSCSISDPCVVNGAPLYPQFKGYLALLQSICTTFEEYLPAIEGLLSSQQHGLKSAYQIAADAMQTMQCPSPVSAADGSDSTADKSEISAAPSELTTAQDGHEEQSAPVPLAQEGHDLLCFAWTVLASASHNLKALHQYHDQAKAPELEPADHDDNRPDSQTSREQAHSSPYALIEQLRWKAITDDVARLKEYRDRLDTAVERLGQHVSAQPAVMSRMPPLSPAYDQLQSLAQVRQLFTMWFNGFDLNTKLDPVIHVSTTIDRIFEYYCLYTILTMLLQQGFKTDRTCPSWRYCYRVQELKKGPDYSTANTFRLFRGTTVITLYYQPVVSGSMFENGLPLFRTDHNEKSPTASGVDRNCFSPDFVMRVTRSSKDWLKMLNDDYVVMDAKYSSQSNIINNYLPDLLNKYVINMSVAITELSPQIPKSTEKADDGIIHSDINDKDDVIKGHVKGTRSVNMVIALQGRVESRETSPAQALSMARGGNNKFRETIDDIVSGTAPDSAPAGSSSTAAAAGTSGSYAPAQTAAQQSTQNKASQNGPVWIKHSSPLARLYAPPFTGASVEINTVLNSCELLWGTITSTLPYLNPEPEARPEPDSRPEPQARTEPKVSSRADPRHHLPSSFSHAP